MLSLANFCIVSCVLWPVVVCPQHLDQFFWAERVQYLNVGSVLERSLFTGREKTQDEPAAALVSKGSSAILSALTPQVSPPKSLSQGKQATTIKTSPSSAG